jgi:hypothetical protein
MSLDPLRFVRTINLGDHEGLAERFLLNVIAGRTSRVSGWFNYDPENWAEVMHTTPAVTAALFDSLAQAGAVRRCRDEGYGYLVGLATEAA